MSTRVSVLMPVYNGERYLKEAVDSILGQTFRDFEFIVVDDGSTDRTGDILREYAARDSRVKVFLKEHEGLPTALNYGLSRTGGELIFRMDADDVALADRFHTQLEVFNNDKNLILLGGWCQIIDSAGMAFGAYRFPSGHADLVRSFEKLFSVFPHSSVCFNKKAVLSAGGYSQKFPIISQDMDLWLKLSEIGRIGCSKRVVVKLRKHSLNISNVDPEAVSMYCAAAAICHFQRKDKFKSFDSLDQEKWAIFLNWIKRRLRETGYLDYLESVEALKLAIRYDGKPGLGKKMLPLAWEIIKSPAIMKALWTRLAGHDIAKRLAEESKSLF